MCQIINNVPICQIGKTHIYGSNLIDSIAATLGTMDYADRCKLLRYNDIIESDHQSYAVEVAIEDYFNDKLCEWDNMNKTMLNPARRSH